MSDKWCLLAGLLDETTGIYNAHSQHDALKPCLPRVKTFSFLADDVYKERILNNAAYLDEVTWPSTEMVKSQPALAAAARFV